LSKTALKKLAKAKQKAAAKAERQQRAREAELAAPAKSYYTGTMAGKHGRAREARLGIQTEGEAATHRARGGAPVLSEVLPEHRDVVVALESVERAMRMRHLPELVCRGRVPMDCHGSMEVEEKTVGSTPAEGDEGQACSLRECGLREFSLTLLTATPSAHTLTSLDLSRNELWTLPGITALQHLRKLDLSRNWFKDVPREVGTLANLAWLDVSYNMLRPNSLLLPQLKVLCLLFDARPHS
jgi:Leucine-rich repeat (LRR) protein